VRNSVWIKDSICGEKSTQVKLLNDTQMWHFITQGYVRVKPVLPPAFHPIIFDEARRNMLEEEPGNNIYPKIGALASVLEDPAVKGALQSVLGKGYMLQAHRHCHESFPGREAQPWHKVSSHAVRSV
jgi:hypothetical protein